MNTRTDKYIALAEELRIHGVSEDVINYVLGKRPSRALSILNDFLVVIVMIAGFVVGAVLWIVGAKYSDAAALEHARVASGVLYEDMFGISGLVALFGWIFASGYIVTRPKLVSDRLIASAFAYSITNAKKYSAPWKRGYLKVDKNLDPSDQLAHVFSAQGAWGKWPAIVLLLGSLFIFDHEMKWHTIYMRDRVIERSQYGLGEWTETPWAEAVTVELGCNHVTGKNPSDDPVYKIAFRNGHSLRLDNAHGVDRSWLDGVEIIDGALSAAGVEFKRWKWMDRNPLHPACLAANRAKFSENDYSRLLKILRVEPDRP